MSRINSASRKEKKSSVYINSSKWRPSNRPRKFGGMREAGRRIAGNSHRGNSEISINTARPANISYRHHVLNLWRHRMRNKGEVKHDGDDLVKCCGIEKWHDMAREKARRTPPMVLSSRKSCAQPLAPMSPCTDDETPAPLTKCLKYRGGDGSALRRHGNAR